MQTITDKVRKAHELLSRDEATTAQAHAAGKLLERLESGNINISIIGQFKRGKSSLANKMLGDDFFPVGIVPITSAVTRVVYGEDKKCEVRFKNGICREIELAELPSFVSEQENSNNALGVDEVIIHAPSEFLKGGITFVDTPGVGSYHQNNTKTAYDYLKESDGVIFLLSVDSPINQIEIEFLKNTKEYVGKFYFAVNKIDTVSRQDLEAYTGYCKLLISQLIGGGTDVAGDTVAAGGTACPEIRLFPVSAVSGEGVEELKAAVLRDSRETAREIMEASAVKKLDDIIDSTVRQLRFYWKAMNMRLEDLDKQFKAVSEFLSEQKAYAAAQEFGFEVHLNIIRLALSDKVMELFGMEYSYEIDTLPAGMAQMDKPTFLAKVDELCDNLYKTLESILLYREENTYNVAHRLNALNRMTFYLRDLQS